MIPELNYIADKFHKVSEYIQNDLPATIHAWNSLMRKYATLPVRYHYKTKRVAIRKKWLYNRENHNGTC